MEKKITIQDRIAGGIFGLLIGDALGVPYEFHDAASLPPADQIEFEPPANFRRSHHGIPPGTWSDDGAQALVLLHSLIECGGFDIDHFAQGLLRWRNDGFMAVAGVVFDVGIQTNASLTELKQGISPKLSGGIDEWSNGNGSLMRCLPIALWHRGRNSELVDLAFAQSAPTHGHLRSKLCCALYCLWARAVIEEISDPWDWAVDALRAELNGQQKTELEERINPQTFPEKIRGSGYVVNSLHAARWALQNRDFESAVKAAVLLGEDTDTTACITGGIAGLTDGVQSIPKRWFDGLRGKEIVEPLVEKVLERVA